MTLIDLIFSVERSKDGVAIFLPTTPLTIDRSGLTISLKPSDQLSINKAYLYKKDHYGVVRHTTTTKVEHRTDYYKRFGEHDFISFNPKLGNKDWPEFYLGPEPVEEQDMLDPVLQGQLSFGPESLEYWAFRALLSVGVCHPEEEPFPKIVSTKNLQDRVE